MMDGTAKDSEGSQKKTVLEDLNKDELIKKCKNLLIIAQRAKQAKDEAGEEVKRLKEELNVLQTNYEQGNEEKKICDTGWKEKEAELLSQISAMQEMLAMLTEQKLHFTIEVDNLKKQNASLEKKLKDVKDDDSSFQMQSRVEELETASESYKRQTVRLTNENETLIQQMEILETEMRKKEDQSKDLTSNQMKLVEELQILHEDVERLSEDNNLKKEQMKQLYQNFNKEKSELENKIEMERQSYETKIEDLNQELKAVIKENEVVLTELNTEKEKNTEIVKEEKECMDRLLDSMKSENRVMVEENCALKLEMNNINQTLETINTEINVVRSENDLLQLEKKEVNDKLNSLISNQNKMDLDLTFVTCQLSDMLNQTNTILQKNSELHDIGESKQTDSIHNIVSCLKENFAEVLSFTVASEKLCDSKYKNNNKISKSKEKLQQQLYSEGDNSIMLVDTKLCECKTYTNIVFQDNFIKLHSELNFLNRVLSNLEFQAENLLKENTELREILNNMVAILKKDSSLNLNIKVLLKNKAFIFENFLWADEDSCKSELDNETCNIDKSEETCFREVQTNKLMDIEKNEMKLREELANCRQTLNKKNSELELVKEELSFVLGKQTDFVMVQKKKRKEVIQMNKSFEESRLCTSEYKQDLFNEPEKEIGKLKIELAKMSELWEDSSVKIKSLNNDIEEKSAEIEELKNVLNNKTIECEIVDKKLVKINELHKSLFEKLTIINVSSVELELLKEIITKIQGDIAGLNSKSLELCSNTDLETKSNQYDRMTDETKLNNNNEDRETLIKDLEMKSKLVEEKDIMIESITKTMNNLRRDLDTTTSELQDKIIKLENETQNYKFLYDEKSIEIEGVNEELDDCKQNSATINEEISNKNKEIESLKVSLLQAESNLAQTLVKISDKNNDISNSQVLLDHLKVQVSNLNEELKNKTFEIANLNKCLEEKQKELYNASKFSNGLSLEIESLKLELDQSQLNYLEIEKQLKNENLSIRNSFDEKSREQELLNKELEQCHINNKELLTELKDSQEKYEQIVKELESVRNEYLCLQSKHTEIQENFIQFESQSIDVTKEVELLKNQLSFSQSENTTLKEDLKLAREYNEEKLKEIENLNSELVNVENASAEGFNQLLAMTTELNSFKDLHSSSSKKLADMFEQLNETTARLAGKDMELQAAQKEIENLKNSNNQVNLKVQQMTTTLLSLNNSVSELNSLRTRLLDEIQSYQTDILCILQQETWTKIMKTVTKYIETQITTTRKENNELLGEMNEMNQVIKQRGETISKLKDMNSELEQRLRDLDSKLQSIQEELKTKISESETKDKTLQKLELDMKKVIEAQQHANHMKDETIHKLQLELAKFMECQHELETKTSALEAKEEMIHNLEAELNKQVDKLKELKSKDKVIHNLEEEIKKLRKNETTEDNRNGNNVNGTRVLELEAELSTLKLRIQQQEHEIEELRKENGDAPSEVMSSSTISKAEESARLKDIEETFEERYTKLRTVAVRLKKKVSELTVQQTQWENDKKKLISDKTDLQSKLTQLSSNAKNLQTMQQEYDNLQDVIESNKLEVKELTKALEAAVNECTSIKLKLHECQEQRDNKTRDYEMCIKDKTNIEVSNKELLSHIQSLKKEKEIENTAKKELEKEFRKLEEDLKLNEKKLTEELEHHKNTQEQLEASKQECKKRSVLSLEMEDYERSLADLTQQLAAEKSKVKELESHLETQRDISRGLQEQISLLEQRILSEEARSKEVKEQLNASRMRLSEVELLALERESSISELASQIEQHRDKNENLALQLSELAAEKQKLLESGRSQQDGLSRQVHILEEQVFRLKDSLAEREEELADLRAEFGNYKVRAQSVLRQKAKPEDGSSFNREVDMEELMQLRQAAEVLKNKLSDASSKLQTLTVENTAIQEDRTRVLQRYQELVDTVQDLRNQNTNLQTQIHETATEHREALRSQKIQAETLNQCYKQQLEELEDRLQKETSVLKKQLKDTEEQLRNNKQNQEQLPTEVNVGLVSPNKHWNTNTGFVPVRSPGDSENKLEINLLEREEGEGSESVDSTSPNLATAHEHRTELIPLDKLLSSPSEDDNCVLSTGTNNSSPSSELGKTKEQLHVSECRIKHLTGLLSETERDLAKLTQQNQVLKEEIRRQQRSVEREQHAQNFEYLKNVVLKFVTLQGGDERSHLVPVLNTILKLSPEETNQLNIVAKGGPELQVNRGWGTYLNLWSGTQ